jgi:N-ethylmaleimide reductase
LANKGYDLELALNARRCDLADLVSFGRLYIANPDLAERLRIGARLNLPDRATFFGGGAAGYTDYPSLTPTERDAATRWTSYGSKKDAATPA